jgi:alanine-alpha-ketoisovalerate/valine-pyruvate aminotransferase
MIKFNMNEYVYLELSDNGMEILLNALMLLGTNTKEQHLTYIQANIAENKGYYKMQFWYALNVFGGHMSMGLNPPFNLNVLLDGYIEETSLLKESRKRKTKDIL